MEVVAVLGASSDSSRYAYKAMKMLEEYGHKPIPVHPREKEVLGKSVFPTLGDLARSGQKIDTVTVYVNAAISEKYEKDFVALKPKRVIFNPGAESPKLEEALSKNGIEVVHACTLVMLRTDQYEQSA
jgi:predicted CoA-binding protein